MAAHAGFQVLDGRPIDKDSIDGQIVADEGRRPQIDFQVKATSGNVIRGETIRFRLLRKNYDDLRRDVIIARILVVVVMPSREQDWLIHTEDELRMRRCGYWLSLAGSPSTTNTSTVTVTIPRAHVLDTAQLRELMGRANRGEAL